MRTIAATFALLLALAAAARAQGPYFRLSWESIAQPMTQPPCDPEDEGAWVYALGAGVVLHCEGAAWVGHTVGQQGPEGPQGPAGADGAGVPQGGMIMWGGTVASIPAGWAICDGSAPNTLDMRGFFAKGAAAGLDAGATGGSATHGHDYDAVIDHFHGLNRFPTTTGASSGFTADTSMSGTPTAVTQTTAAASGGVATGTTATASSDPAHRVVLFICKT